MRYRTLGAIATISRVQAAKKSHSVSGRLGWSGFDDEAPELKKKDLRHIDPDADEDWIPQGTKARAIYCTTIRSCYGTKQAVTPTK